MVFCERCVKPQPLPKEGEDKEALPLGEGWGRVNNGWIPVSEKDLPVKLPEVKSYKPTNSGESPLASISKWVNTKCPKCKGKAKEKQTQCLIGQGVLGII